MVTGRSRRRLSLERLEPRLTMSASLPADTIGVSEGVVSGPGASGSASVAVETSNLAQGRSSTVIGLAVTPVPGSVLSPRIVSAFGPSGKRFPVYQQGSLGAKLGGPATILVLDDQAGLLTVDVAGKKGTSGSFQLQVYLPGDVDGSGHVDDADLLDIAASYGSKVGDPNYNPAADSLRTGRIAQQDVRLLVRNLSNPTPDVPQFLNVKPGSGRDDFGTAHLQLGPGHAE